ncbi:hypothetical protein [Mastigocladopsis repens]|nr:hypothetical protein [Mastigocladopsis repens]
METDRHRPSTNWLYKSCDRDRITCERFAPNTPQQKPVEDF